MRSRPTAYGWPYSTPSSRDVFCGLCWRPISHRSYQKCAKHSTSSTTTSFAQSTGPASRSPHEKNLTTPLSRSQQRSPRSSWGAESGVCLPRWRASGRAGVAVWRTRRGRNRGAGSKPRRHTQRPVSWPRAVWRPPGKLVESHLNRAVQLRIGAARIVLRRVVHLDVRVGAVVLDSPAHVVKEERELRLGGDCPVDQTMAWPDADDAAPGPFADQWTQLHQLEGVREDVAVRSSQLIGQGDHRPGRRLIRVWLGR